MLNRMKNDILTLGNLPTLKKEIRKNTVLTILIFLFLIIFRSDKENNIGIMNIICFGGIILILFLGIITTIKIKKNKRIFIFFKAFFLLMFSFEFLLITYNVVDVILKIDNFAQIYLYMTVIFYLLIIIISSLYIKRKLKIKEKDTRKKSDRIIVSIIISISFAISPVMVMLVKRYSNQVTTGIMVIVLFLIVSYITAFTVPYYFIEYLISRKIR